MSVSSILTSCLIVQVDGKASETFVVDVNAPGINTSNHDVDTQVKLQSVNQKWIDDVFTDDTLFVYWYFRDVINLRKVMI
jgi:hypothetical protein